MTRTLTDMEVIKTDIEGVVIIEPRIFKDARGYFFESYSKKEFDEKVRPVDFVQDNESMSAKGVMRGLHFQRPPYTQSKLVRCVKGRVLDVAVDIRKGSPTYGKHVAVELSEDNHRQFFVPRGFAHGFAVLSDVAVFQYKCDNFYHHRTCWSPYIGEPTCDQSLVRLFSYDSRSCSLYEERFMKGYKFMKVEREQRKLVYYAECEAIR